MKYFLNNRFHDTKLQQIQYQIFFELIRFYVPQVWLLILLSLLVVGPIMYLVMYLRVRIGDNKDIKVYPLSACVWFVYGALMKQGSTLNPVTGKYTVQSTLYNFTAWDLIINKQLRNHNFYVQNKTLTCTTKNSNFSAELLIPRLLKLGVV